jgi:signal transduction histidine kinase
MAKNPRPPTRLVVFQLAVILPTIGVGAFLLVRNRDSLSPWLELVLWTIVIAVVEYLPIPAWHGLRVGMGFPLMLMVGIIYSPLSAGVTAMVGSLDPREFRREVHPLVALFNRAQVALSVSVASFAFHWIADIHTSPTWVLLIAAMAAAIVDYLINSGIVTGYVTIQSGLSPKQVIADLRVGRLGEFLMSYLGLGALGLALAELFLQVKWWSLPTFFAPLLLARQMLFRSQALEEAHTELKEREQILKQLSNAIAEERHDEREQIANYLHDDLAQVLFRLSIQVDVARKQLEKGEFPDVEDSLEKIRDAKQDTSDRIRALIRDLHRSPLGAKGLAEAIQSFTDEMGRDSGVTFHTDVADVRLPAPIALLVYHIAREGVMNALKHAHATDMWISVSEDVESIEFELRDNGRGFDTSAPGPEGHYGMAMMRGRATVAGGTFEVTSVPDQGTTITARFPISLLQQDGAPDTDGAGGDAPGAGASHGTSGTTSQGDERSPEPVPTSS